MQRLARRALREGETADPLSTERGGPRGPDQVGVAVAELVTVEGVAEVEELRIGGAGRHPHRLGQRRDGVPGRPVGIGVPDRAATLAQPAPTRLGIAEEPARREGRGVAGDDEAVPPRWVASGRHRGANAVQRSPQPTLGRGQRRAQCCARLAAAERRFTLVAACPIECTTGNQVAEADVVGTRREHDHPHLGPLGHAGELVDLRRLAEVRFAARRRWPEVAQTRSRAGQIQPLVDRDRGAGDRRHVGAVATVLLAVPVDPLRRVGATPAAAGIRLPVGPGAATTRFTAVAEPAPTLAGDEAVAERDYRRWLATGPCPRPVLRPPPDSHHQRRARRGDNPPHVSPF